MIRDYRDDDADAAAALLTAHSPWFYSAAGLRHRQATLPPRAHRAAWVANDDGAVVAWGEAEFDWTAVDEGIGTLYVLVAEAQRRRGLGSELFELAVAHLTARGARELRTWSFRDSDEFLERRGFRPSRNERVSAVDPRRVDTSALDSLPTAVRIVPLSELGDDLRDVHELYAEAASDMPADHPELRVSYDEWLAETVGDPDLTHDGSVVVLVDDRPAALSFLRADTASGRAEHDLTGTARAHRRRGLGRLAKLGAMRWAAANGVTRVSTGNDETNAGMLAINDEVGFRPFAVETEWVKQVT